MGNTFFKKTKVLQKKSLTTKGTKNAERKGHKEKLTKKEVFTE